MIRRIRQLYRKGYVIKLPGGTDRFEGGHACFASIIKKKYVKGGYKYQIVVIPYYPLKKGEKRKEDKKEKKFPETIDQTVEREVLEETGISLAKGLYAPITEQEIPDNREGYKGEKHKQVNFLVTQYDDSNMRVTISPKETRIGIPFWVDLDDDLEKYIDSAHRWMIKDVRNYISHQPGQNLNLKKIHSDAKYQPALAS